MIIYSPILIHKFAVHWRKLNNETYIPIISLSEVVGFLMLKINYQKLKESEENNYGNIK